MIDIEKVDKLFEVGKTTGMPLQFSIFDKRVLLPVSQLPGAVMGETGEAISEEEIRAQAEEKWFLLLKGAGVDSAEEGVPLYVPSRIGLFTNLRRDGYGADELRLIAEIEEWTIENILTVEDLAYIDDDLTLLLVFAKSRIDALEHVVDGSGRPGSTTAEYGEALRQLEFLQRLQAQGIPDRLVVRIEGVKVEGILWDQTLQDAMAYGSMSDPAPIRVPGFLLKGNQVIPTRTLRPAEYGNLWREFDLDEYLECWSTVRGERQCLNCHRALPGEADDRKRFCGEKCRNAAKQRRFRERNPDSVERAQRRYWGSLGC